MNRSKRQAATNALRHALFERDREFDSLPDLVEHVSNQVTAQEQGHVRGTRTRRERYFEILRWTATAVPLAACIMMFFYASTTSTDAALQVRTAQDERDKALKSLGTLQLAYDAEQSARRKVDAELVSSRLEVLALRQSNDEDQGALAKLRLELEALRAMAQGGGEGGVPKLESGVFK